MKFKSILVLFLLLSVSQLFGQSAQKYPYRVDSLWGFTDYNRKMLVDVKYNRVVLNGMKEDNLFYVRKGEQWMVYYEGEEVITEFEFGVPKEMLGCLIMDAEPDGNDSFGKVYSIEGVELFGDNEVSLSLIKTMRGWKIIKAVHKNSGLIDILLVDMDDKRVEKLNLQASAMTVKKDLSQELEYRITGNYKKVKIYVETNDYATKLYVKLDKKVEKIGDVTKAKTLVYFLNAIFGDIREGYRYRMNVDGDELIVTAAYGEGRKFIFNSDTNTMDISSSKLPSKDWEWVEYEKVTVLTREMTDSGSTKTYKVMYEHPERFILYSKEGKKGLITEHFQSEAIYDEISCLNQGLNGYKIFVVRAKNSEGEMKTGLIDASGHSIAEVGYDSIAMDSIGAYNMCKLYLGSGFILMGRNFLPISDQPIDDFYTVTFPGYTNTWKKQEAEPILVYRIGDKYGIFNMSEPDMEMSAMYDYKVTRLVTISGTDFVQLEQDSTLLGYADLYGNYFWKRE